MAFQWRGQRNDSPIHISNPRVENLWQYLKRRFGYRTGIVTTADVTDATPAVEGSYSGYRQTRFEIARQYVENPMLGGRPAFDVIMGGGIDQFVPAARPDGRHLIAEFQALGFQYVTNATDLERVRPAGGLNLLGLFKGNAKPASNSARLAATDSNMDVAYDKLLLPRPASEPLPDFGGFTDQPMLDRMTAKAIEFLSGGITTPFGSSSAPFILMVEGASIDKQSHPNNASGTIWDTIELDRAVGVARTWAGSRGDTLIVVTADHDQSMSIIGVSNVPDTEYFDRGRKQDYTGSSVPVTAEGPGAFLFTGYMDQTDLFFKMAVALSGDTADGDKLINDILKRYPATVGK